MASKNIYGCRSVISNVDNKFHYVYRITNLKENKHYYGSRSSLKDPKSDLGSSYFGSPSASTNKFIIDEQKNRPNFYKYKIIRCFMNRRLATEFETIIHKKFNVANNDRFYNESNQRCDKFDTTGKSSVTKGTKWFFNESTQKHKRFKEGEQTDGYVLGTSKESKKRKSVGHIGVKWYSDPESNQEASFKEGLQPPGWICGRLPFSEETRIKIGIAATGKNHSEETKEILRIKSTGRSHNEKTKKHLSERNIGRGWWHNPLTGETKRFFINDIKPEGFIKGRS